MIWACMTRSGNLADWTIRPSRDQALLLLEGDDNLVRVVPGRFVPDPQWVQALTEQLGITIDEAKPGGHIWNCGCGGKGCYNCNPFSYCPDCRQILTHGHQCAPATLPAVPE